MYILYILYIYTTYILRIPYITLYNLLCDFTYHSLSHSLIGSIVARTIFTNSLSSTLSSYNTYLIRSVTLASSSLLLFLKTSIISKLLIKDIVLPSSFAFIYTKWLIIPKHPLLLQSQHHTKTVAFILSSNKVIPLYSRCVKKGLVYIIIAALSSCQPSSYSRCTSINTQLSYNVHLVSNAKYIYTHLRNL